VNDARITQRLLRLLQKLEPSLERREPSLAEGFAIIEAHGIADNTMPELARMGFAKPRRAD
jgi:hypothetical protein